MRIQNWCAAMLCIALAACGTAPSPAQPSAAPTDSPGQGKPSTTPAPRAYLPGIAIEGRKRVLFINGDHIPETGYPHSRVRDDGSKPESFSRLRTEVLEGDLQLSVDEYILTANTAITPTLLSPYTLVVLGSNSRLLDAGEVAALTEYYEAGGRILVYADFQYGPDNWASDNSFLNQFGIEVFPDNFQPTTQITDIVSSHPIMQGVASFATEGSSQFLLSAARLSEQQVLAKCSPLERSGCALQPAEQAKIRPGDVVACTWVRENARGGKLAGTCDRNTFHNGPGPGTDIDEFDNRTYARNLFRWLTQ
ncbi:MAG: hypothetical protein CUN48_09300 [Candidatus Thermofonsia Clade 3 bacterium]|jgi:hypothetical protein|uniref:DUF4350 domain-containing protein n=1 Tax=Candidatus Thermofonsia Clade 3 bacterium TaxID=2364212 RepID=A0A2M8QBZ2_9CHLR|nr:hypothetical protein [Candidatus Roseilinea sp. NK_OTU-006]PJF47316.1 MAG: hypothetical protein CUN48_09300 [Candidatus Thermofonsia Clade 3 bacterium]